MSKLRRHRTRIDEDPVPTYNNMPPLNTDMFNEFYSLLASEISIKDSEAVVAGNSGVTPEFEK